MLGIVLSGTYVTSSPFFLFWLGGQCLESIVESKFDVDLLIKFSNRIPDFRGVINIESHKVVTKCYAAE